MKTTDKSINYQFKLIYAISIIFVVAGHCNYGGISFLNEWFNYYSFHVAIFVFCSGYFYKKDSKNNVGRYIVKKAKSLLLPVYAYNVVYGVLVIISRKFGFTIGQNFNLFNIIIAPLINGHQFGYNLGGWCIASFFLVQVFNVVIRRLLFHIDNDFAFFAIYLIIGLLGILSAVHGSYSTWYGLVIDRFCYFLPFFAFGTLYRNVLEKKISLNSYAYFLILFILQLLIITKYGRAMSYTPAWCNDFDNAYMPFVVAFIGILFWLRVTRILCPILGHNRLLLKISNCTYSIMINQFVFMMGIKTVFATANKLSGGSLCRSFDWYEYKSDIWYYYAPHNLSQWKILYLIAGVLGPVLIQMGIDSCRKKLRIYFQSYRA